MKLSESWLREWINPAISTQQLADQLTMAGLEVDAIEPASRDLIGIVIGKVVTLKPHPDANKLTVCQVAINEQETLQIVCGAHNVAEGIKVPVATIGTKLNAEVEIKPVKLRGIDSYGMLCSAEELGLAEKSQGLMILPEDAPVGSTLSDYLKLNDHIICLDLTPNRADCLSVLGLARETAVLNQQTFNYPTFPAIPSTGNQRVTIKNEAPERTPRYAARIISNLPKDSASPLWLTEKLRRCGIRSLHPIVDITNYVMLELGQPMHAFDLDKLKNHEIQVRQAKAGEKISLLNQQELTLTTNTLVIADAEQPIALAGIMGGSQTAVTESTQTILLESAYFAPQYLSGCARSYGLHTDSSHRFERGVDINLIEQAIERASQLILDIVGGVAHDICVSEDDKHLPKQQTIQLDTQKIQQTLGINIEPAKIAQILEQLGFTVSTQHQPWQVSVPSHRVDVTKDIDLIEEIARIYGYDHIPNQPIVSSITLSTHPESSKNPAYIGSLMTARGYSEAITYSFIDPKISQLLFPEQETLKLHNPISSDMSTMRPSLWPGLLMALKHNRSHQIDRIKLFELGRCFTTTNGKTTEDNRLAAVITGSLLPENWANTKQSVDFFDLKSDVEQLLQSFGQIGKIKFRPTQHEALHPSEAACLQLDETDIGLLGKLNPKICQALDLPTSIYLFECYLDQIEASKLPKLRAISSFPSVRRDIAITLPRDIPVDQVIEHIKSIGGDELINCILFDLYQGDKIAANEKSIALGLTLQSSQSTLKDEEIKQLMDNIVLSLTQTFNATLRQ